MTIPIYGDKYTIPVGLVDIIVDPEAMLIGI